MSEATLKAEGTLKVVVHYPAAKKPFEQEHAGRKETIGTLKSAVLAAFGLTEGKVPTARHSPTLCSITRRHWKT